MMQDCDAQSKALKHEDPRGSLRPPQILPRHVRDAHSVALKQASPFAFRRATAVVAVARCNAAAMQPTRIDHRIPRRMRTSPSVHSLTQSCRMARQLIADYSYSEVSG